MQLFSFRNRTLLRRIGIALLIVLLVLAIIAAALLIYLQRYLVYGKDGAYFDFSRESLQAQAGSAETSDPVQYDFSGMQLIETAPQEDVIAASSGVLSGYYITAGQLSDPDAVLSACEALEPCALMFDAKDGVGNFYYSSSISDQGPESTNALDTIVPALKAQGFYLIARISAFRDRSFALENISCGLPLSSGALWMDSIGCYWLDPLDDAVQVRLSRICAELFSLGFDEVVLTNFYFPDGDGIVYEAENGTDDVIAQSAKRIRDALKGSGTVSFQVTQEQVALDPGSGRLYLQTDNAQLVDSMQTACAAYLSDPAAQLVFLTDSHDTRFAACGQLRALE